MLGQSPATAGRSPEGLEARRMTTADLLGIEPETEARVLVQIIAGPMRLGENVKAALARVARATGLGERRVRGIWNSEARSIRSVEMDRLRIAALDARERQDARDEYRTVLARLAQCEATLRVSRPDTPRTLDHEGVEQSGRCGRPVDCGAVG